MSGSDISHVTFEPLSAKPAESLSSGPSGSALLTGAPPREKVRSCCVRSRARAAAFSASTRSSVTSLDERAAALASERYPQTAVRMLLKSCAIPPARMPTVSSLCALISSSSILQRSVMSLITLTSVVILPPEKIGDQECEIRFTAPSFVTTRYSKPEPLSPAIARSRICCTLVSSPGCAMEGRQSVRSSWV